VSKKKRYYVQKHLLTGLAIGGDITSYYISDREQKDWAGHDATAAGNVPKYKDAHVMCRALNAANAKRRRV
jgi:hypothetical protein